MIGIHVWVVEKCSVAMFSQFSALPMRFEIFGGRGKLGFGIST
jgi:hypothetical protein